MSPVCRSGGRWRDRRADAQQRPHWQCIPSSNPRVRSCEGWDSRSMTGVSSDPCGMARSAGGGAAGCVARVSVSRGEASGSRPARAGISARVEIDTRVNAQGNWLQGRPRILRGRRGTNTICSSRNKPGTCGDMDTEPKGENGPGRRRAGRFVQSGRTTFFPAGPWPRARAVSGASGQQSEKKPEGQPATGRPVGTTIKIGWGWVGGGGIRLGPASPV